MPFQKGRAKTGGRQKGGSLKNSKRFIDQLQRYGLNTAKELAHGLMGLQPKERFEELRKLLPYLIPKLKEIDPINPDDNDLSGLPSLSNEDLLGALKKNGRTEKPIKSSPSSVPVVETGNSDVQVPTSPATDLRHMDGEQDPH